MICSGIYERRTLYARSHLNSILRLSVSSIVAVGVDRDALVYGKARVAEVSAVGYRTGRNWKSCFSSLHVKASDQQIFRRDWTLDAYP